MDGAGNVYVADQLAGTIRKITRAGAVSTVAGSVGQTGSTDGNGSAARFYNPHGLAVDGSGNVYVADTDNCTIRKITSTGVVSTLAGSAGQRGSTDGTSSAARFSNPQGVAVDASGNVYVADTYSSTIRKITSAGVVTTLAGLAGQAGSTDGTGPAARLSYPQGVAVDAAGNVYVADSGSSTIRRITAAGVVTTLAGSAGTVGSADAIGSAARFSSPYGVAVDGAGNVYVADSVNATIRKITPAAVVTTLAGSAGQSGSADGTGSAARFNYPYAVAVDGTGTVYVADWLNSTIRKITSAGAVTTLAGSPRQSGSSDGTGSVARFYNPQGVAADGSGNIYVADTFKGSIRKITPAGVVSALADATGSAVRFYNPFGVAVDGSGNILVADSGNDTIRKITPAGEVSTVAGFAGESGSNDGTGSAARFRGPGGVAVDGSGNIYVADMYNSTIRKITLAGVVSTLAGSAGQTGSIDGTGSAARFYYPDGVAVDGSGNVYVADRINSTIRKITPAGVVTTLAGTAVEMGSTDGTGSAARFYNPHGVAVDGSGNVYVADTDNSTIRKITAEGAVTTVVGTVGVSGTVAGPLPSTLFQPTGVAFVPRTGSLFITVPDAVLEAFF